MAAPRRPAARRGDRPVAPPAPRHEATRQILRYFAFTEESAERQAITRPCWELATAMVDALPDGQELTTGLRKLLEAKDCFVRAIV